MVCKFENKFICKCLLVISVLPTLTLRRMIGVNKHSTGPTGPHRTPPGPTGPHRGPTVPHRGPTGPSPTGPAILGYVHFSVCA